MFLLMKPSAREGIPTRFSSSRLNNFRTSVLESVMFSTLEMLYSQSASVFSSLVCWPIPHPMAVIINTICLIQEPCILLIYLRFNSGVLKIEKSFDVCRGHCFFHTEYLLLFGSRCEHPRIAPLSCASHEK